MANSPRVDRAFSPTLTPRPRECEVSRYRHGSDPPKSKANGTRIAFYVLTASILILSIEIGAQSLIFAFKGYWPFQWSPNEEFLIRDFSVATDDARGYTARPRFTNPNYHGAGWSISFDEFGFRNGKQTGSATSQSNIVFIGDSVPFGWGVSENSSLPSQFFERLQEHSRSLGVVNAALPSYSLAQAVARYEQEIHGRIAADTVYLQIYDPAVQLAIRGARWQPSDTWGNRTYAAKSLLYHHSAIVVTLGELPSLLHINVGRTDSLVETFDPSDAATAKRVYVHVRDQLELLLALSKTDGVRHLVVAPITIPAQSYRIDHYSPIHQSAVELVNQSLRQFASSHPNEVIFADTISLLRSYPEADVFIDHCCHLSERGNGIVADYLMGLLLNSGHFSQNQVLEKLRPVEVSPQPALGSQPSQKPRETKQVLGKPTLRNWR